MALKVMVRTSKGQYGFKHSLRVILVVRDRVNECFES